jgi:hypothetical protein
LDLAIAAQLPKLGGSAASLSATAQLNLDAELVHLSSAVFDYRGQQLRLLKPAQISLAGGVTIKQLEIGAQEAVFQLDGRILPTLDLSASLHHLKPSLVDALMRAPISRAASKRRPAASALKRTAFGWGTTQ